MKEQPIFKYIELDNLQFDIYSPRLPKSKQGIDEDVVLEYLLLESLTTELMLSVGENDFFAGEMLWVVPSDNAPEKYIVVEGNRRLAAILLLNKPELAKVRTTRVKEIFDTAKYKPTNLPCLVFDDRNEIQKNIGFVHIKGKQNWLMLEKARYLYELRNSDTFKDVPLKQVCIPIAKMIGTRSLYVRKILVSYELYKIVEAENFYGIDDSSNFSFCLYYIAEGLLMDNISNFINVDMFSDNPLENVDYDHLQELIVWYCKKAGLRGDDDGMKYLDAVLGNEVALQAFRNGSSIQQAYALTNDIESQFRRKVTMALEAMEQADRLSTNVNDFYIGLSDDLKEIRQIALKMKDVKERKEKGGDDF